MNPIAQKQKYTVAVVSDVHGNAAALRAVLKDLESQKYDELVFAGDYVLFGPRPAETLHLVQEQYAKVIYGNTDRFISHNTGPEKLQPSVEWTAYRIGDHGIKYLADLPFKYQLTPPGGKSPDNDLLVVHATPTDVDAVLILEPDPFNNNCVTEEEEAAAMLGNARADLIVYGHIHYASQGMIKGQRLQSIGSVGFPFDGKPQAAYAFADWDGSKWEVRHRRVAYDYTTAAEELAATAAPFAGFAAERLRMARFIPMGI